MQTWRVFAELVTVLQVESSVAASQSAATVVLVQIKSYVRMYHIHGIIGKSNV